MAMALIACAECHREMSDQALACPHCAVPTSLSGSVSSRLSTKPPTRRGPMSAAAPVFGLASALSFCAFVAMFAISKSAVHEIEALIWLLISAVFGVGAVLAASVRRLDRR